MPATFTPLRYPGGKSSLYPLVTKIINERNLKNSHVYRAICRGSRLSHETSHKEGC